MSVSEYPVKKAAAARVEKFSTPAQIESRLQVLNAMQFKLFQPRLKKLKNPTLL